MRKLSLVLVGLACALASCGAGHQPAQCRWHVSYAGYSALAGSLLGWFNVTNTSPRSCVIGGYPHIVFYGANGRRLPAYEVRGHFVLDSGVHRIAVGSRRTAHFTVPYRLQSVDGQVCAHARRAQIHLPGVRGSESVPLPTTFDKKDFLIPVTPCRGGFNVTALATE